MMGAYPIANNCGDDRVRMRLQFASIELVVRILENGWMTTPVLGEFDDGNTVVVSGLIHGQ